MKKVLLLLTVFFIALITVRGQRAPNRYSYRLGAFRVTMLCDAGPDEGKSDRLIGVSPEMMQRYMPDRTYVTAINTFLIQTPARIILVDTGLGNRLFDNLSAVGVTPGDIDVVFLTHMHGDHIGGLLHEGRPAFPKATVYLSQREYDYWTSDEAMNRAAENRRGGFLKAREAIGAYKERIKLVEPVRLGTKNGEELFPGIQAVAAYGHTPGHVMLRLESGECRMMVWGDLIHAAAIQMPCPQVSLVYDVDPVEAAGIRKKVLEYVNDNGFLGAGMHIPYPGILSLQQDHAGGYIHTLLGKP